MAKLLPIPGPSLSHVPKAERYAALTALFISVVLTGLKFWAYFATGSAAVFSDALESIVNVAASAFALYAIALSHEPADESHPYGHGKVEFLSATFEGGMIFIAGAVVIWHAIEGLINGAKVSAMTLGSVLLIVASIVNYAAGTVLVRIGKKRKSLALEADGRHLLADVVTSIGVLLSLLLVWLTGKAWIDALTAGLVGLYLFYTAARLLRESTAGLMDEQDRADDHLLREILDRHVTGVVDPRICSYHKLRHRHAGRMHWIDFHVLVPADTTVEAGHKIASKIEHEMERALVDADATAHIEPCLGCEACAAVR